MALGDRGIAAPEHGGNRASDNVAATEHDRVAAGNGDAGVVEKLDAARGSAGREERLRSARRQVADVVCMETLKIAR